MLEIQCNNVYFPIMYNNKVSQNCHQMLSFLFDSYNMIILCMFISFICAIKKIFFKFRNVSKQFLSVFKDQQQKSPFSLSTKMSKIRSYIPFFKFSNHRRSIFQKLIGRVYLVFDPSSKSNDDTVRTSQSKHSLKYVQEYLRMVREVTIDKENLDYLNHHDTFYICDMTDNLQCWMLLKRSHLLVPLQILKPQKKKFHSPFFELKKKKKCHDMEGTFVGSLHGHNFLMEINVYDYYNLKISSEPEEELKLLFKKIKRHYNSHNKQFLQAFDTCLKF
ncbi:hypothetical protein RFI_05052 [Reticulomyxa filosa]|uniref:Uncharacterized protein n=1 Tax=Reticulomyxa filosa TaxID=46433 RepID=X6P0H9_RETFI|nr:hypothetical protein RFI_05052 [Reticulomyxa filosa]|eukprot:ETO32065.1 hypothetical protein RFI_05052 [Reticulomyxa filosa]